MSIWLIIAIFAGGAVLTGLIAYAISRYYEARYDRTFMTHDERGFRRALAGRGVIWDFEETVVKGPAAPNVEFVALDTATGGRRTVSLLDRRTGSVNLRPQYCVPIPFPAVTEDSHSVMVEARVQFSLNRNLLKHVYEVQDFSLALETRIQSAFRAEIGKRHDEQLRANLHEVERAVIEHLRTAEKEGDEAGEPGMALGVNFHSASFTYSQPDEFASPMAAGLLGTVSPTTTGGAGGAVTVEQARALVRSQGVLALRPQQLDQLADVFREREPASTEALLTLLDMQTRQNIAEALAASGQLLVLTPQELGLLGVAASRDAMGRNRAVQPVARLGPNGGASPAG